MAVTDKPTSQFPTQAVLSSATRASLNCSASKLRDTTIYAPFAGAVKERQVTPSQFVGVNTPLFTLVKTDPLRLRLEVPERVAPWIKTGQVADVSVEAFGGRTFQGEVWRISPTNRSGPSLLRR